MTPSGMLTPKEFEELTKGMQEFPLYYQDRQQFLLSGQPSGAATAVARANIPLSNAPHLFIGLRLRNVYTVVAETLTAATTLQALLKQGQIDDEQSVRISLAQQNITAGFVLQPLICGAGGVNWHPFPIPFGFRGSNIIEIEVRRETAYPTYVEGFPILPTLHIGLVTTQFVSDRAPASTPGSSGRP